MMKKTEKNKKEEKILCPQCLEPIDTNLNELMKSNGKSIEKSDFTKLSCQKCPLDFTFISCVYCNGKIFMKMHPKGVEFNGLNGYNVYCPYISCNKHFYFTKCPKCQKVQKQKNSIKEGNIITCTNDKCNYQYIQVNCPTRYCTDLMSLEKPKIQTNFPNGIMFLHKGKIMYQKINCNYCYRPIVFASTKTCKNKYCEGQKVECPYTDCKKTFNRLICPKCLEEIYINEGWYEMGSKIKCHKCKKYFGKIICPTCGKMNTCDQMYFKLGRMKCGFNNCLKDNNMINCLFCRKLNILNKETQISGQVIKCGYCGNTFNEIFCPFCCQTNPFPLADFSFGKVYKCKYLSCMKEFQFLICPNCHTPSFIKEKEEGIEITCEVCHTVFMNWSCPFCKSNTMDKNTNLKFGQLIRCPSEKCKKVYSFLKCFGCKKLIFSKENENICGKAVKCPYQNCKVYTLNTYCPLCHVKATYTGKKQSLNEGESVICEKCKNNYIFQKNNCLYKGNLTVLEQIEGKPIGFGVGQTDENYLAIQDLFLNKKYPSMFVSEQSDKNTEEKKTIRSNNNINLGECMVCHNNLKESIFVPCGHRCVCYNCAVILFAVTKKCPRCNKEASCIIKKVYE